MTKKAHAIAADIASELTLRLPALVITEAVDSDLLPLVKVGDGSAGSASAVIKVIPQDWPLAKDILGLTATIFTPHKIQVVLEANPAGGAGADHLTWAQRLPILGVVLGKGTCVEIYEGAAGATIEAGDITSGNLKATFDGSLVHGMLSNQ